MEDKTDGGLLNLKSEAELKEQMEELGMRFRYGCYQDKLPESCHSLGQWFENFLKDSDKAAPVFKHNCDTHNFGESCLKFANCLLSKRGVPKDIMEAYRYFEKGCLAGKHPRSCHAAGMMLANAMTTHKADNEGAEKMFIRGCELGFGQSCFHAAGLYLSGLHAGGKEGTADLDKAFRYSSRGCELGHFMSCGNVGTMYSRGDGVAKDEGLAKTFMEKAETLRKSSPTFQSA